MGHAEVTLEHLEWIIALADMYQMDALAMKCAEILRLSISERIIIVILRCLGTFRQTSSVLQRAFDSVIETVKAQPALLLAVCMYLSNHDHPMCVRQGRVGKLSEAKNFTSNFDDVRPEDKTIPPTISEEPPPAVSVIFASGACPNAGGQSNIPIHGEVCASPRSHDDGEDIEREKQTAVLASIEVATAQENSALSRALLESKRDMPEPGVPLSGDGVVILRLTRMARSPEVHAKLTESSALSHCHKRVTDAGCS